MSPPLRPQTLAGRRWNVQVIIIAVLCAVVLFQLADRLREPPTIKGGSDLGANMFTDTRKNNGVGRGGGNVVGESRSTNADPGLDGSSIRTKRPVFRDPEAPQGASPLSSADDYASGAPPYTALVHALVLDELGPDLAGAVYDPDFLEMNIVLEAHAARLSKPQSATQQKSPNQAKARDGGEGSGLDPKEGHEVGSTNRANIDVREWSFPPEPPVTSKDSSAPFVSPHHLYFEEQGFHYHHLMIRNLPTVPAAMATIPMTLMTLKRAMSIGLGRIARDARLAANYNEIVSAGLASGGARRGEVVVFRRSLRTMIKGYAQYATSFLQIMIDGNGRLTEIANWERATKAAAQKMAERAAPRPAGEGGEGDRASGASGRLESAAPCSHYETCDPLLLLMGSMRISPPRWAVEALVGTGKTADGGDARPLAINLDASPTTQILRSLTRNRASIAMSLVHGTPVTERLRPLSSRGGLGISPVTVASPSSASHPANVMAGLSPAFKKAMIRFGQFSRGEAGASGATDGTENRTGDTALLPILVVDEEGGAVDSSMSESTTFSREDLTVALAVEVEQIWIRRLAVLDAIVSTATIPPALAAELGRLLPRSTFSFSANRGLFGLEYQTNLPYTGSGAIVNGRFWNTIRPTVGCASIHKQCEEPDGCRYFCNLDYMLAVDGFKTSPFSSTRSPDAPPGRDRYGHQVIGFGSNNEYDWEVSLAGAFERANRAFAGTAAEAKTPGDGEPDHHTNILGRVTVFDCTVKNWSPPKQLTGVEVGFGHGTYCLDNRLNLPRNMYSAGSSTISFPFLKHLLADMWSSNPLKVRRYTTPDVGPQGVPPIEHKEADDTQLITPPPFFNPLVFDEVSIMKLDVEGFEHRTLPQWLTSELSDLGRTRLERWRQASVPHPRGSRVRDSGGGHLIAFDTEAPSTFTVSHYGMELHRLGHKDNRAASYAGALRTHYTLMQLYALGFAMFGQEKNPTDYCCYEIGMVHYRHYVRSETWHAIKA